MTEPRRMYDYTSGKWVDADELEQQLAASVVRPLTITVEQRDAILEACGIPAAAVLGDPVDDLVHWRGLDSQETFTPLGMYRPTRCGHYGIATLGYPLEHVTCPKCRELAEADDG